MFINRNSKVNHHKSLDCFKKKTALFVSTLYETAMVPISACQQNKYYFYRTQKILKVKTVVQKQPWYCH